MVDFTRLCMFFLLTVCVFLVPFWINIALWIIYLYFYRNAYEVLFFGFLCDVLYGAPLMRWHAFPVVTLGLAVVLCVSMNLLKTRLIR